MDFKYELTVVPVSDVDRAKEFYEDRMGFKVDVDHRAVTDIEAARDELLARGVEVSERFHFGPRRADDGLHPERADYGTFASLRDPDGNGWLIQEVNRRAPGR